MLACAEFLTRCCCDAEDNMRSTLARRVSRSPSSSIAPAFDEVLKAAAIEGFQVGPVNEIAY